jgi:DNA-binding transcriptional LysR family regulator
MRYDLVDLRLLVTVAEAGGIAAAARQANLSVSALSERIKALEENVGLALFTRGARGSVPTAAGHDLAAYARAVLLQAERFNGAVATLKGRPTGEVRIMANSNAIVSFLPDVLAKFLASHPDVIINLTEAPSDDIARSIRAGEADVGVAAGNAQLDGLHLIPFRTDSLVLLVPAGHRFEGRKSIEFVESLDEYFIGLDDRAAIQTYIAARANRLGRKLSVRIHLRGFDGVGRMVAAGAGIAVVPASTVSQALHDLGARAVPLSDSWAVRDLVVCLPKAHGNSALINRLVERITAPDLKPDDKRTRRRRA